MALGDIPRDWRDRRIAVRASFAKARPFVDVEAAGTRKALSNELTWLLDAIGLDDIDVAAIRSSDRRLTRWVSQFVYQARFDYPSREYSGVRFSSRLNDDWELWAVYEDVQFEEQERRPVLIQDDALRAVATEFELNLH